MTPCTLHLPQCQCLLETRSRGFPMAKSPYLTSQCQPA